MKPFAPGFTWGVSTAAYQIEGAVNEDGRGPSIWDIRCRQKGGIGDGSNADIAADHYHRWQEDVGLIKDLGVDAYRFSVAWPRILPRGRGQVNEAGLAFYDRLVDSLLERGIDPWLTLYHWDLPQKLDDLGGWTNRDCASWYADYAAVVAARVGDRVKRWVTFNEFSVFTLFGYAIDWAAPGAIDREAHLRAIHHVNLAHGMGVDVLRDVVPDASIGAIHNCQPVFPENGLPENAEAAALLDEHWNLAFPDPQLLGHYPPRIAEAIAPYVQAGDMARIRRRIDWIGLNHYGPIWAKADPAATWGFSWGSEPADAPKFEGGWAIFPEAFRDELLRLHGRYKLPIVVTENGCGGPAGVNDDHRIAYLSRYLGTLTEAIEAGADVRGYFLWSLMDCFEWGSGYGPRFGLYDVNFDTMERTAKKSAAWYRDWVANAKR